MNHDQRFKELLTAFFGEFVSLFLPDVADYLDPDAPVEFLDKEVFTDISAGDRHEADLVVKARFRDQEAFFLIHVENQAKAQSSFPMRMFVYFARLHEKYSLPVYPVVIFSYDTPTRAEPDRYTVAFPGKTVLQFDYTVIQLNRLSWRDFVHQSNPVASALMAKMQMKPEERPKVKVECLRLLATLRLDPAKSALIGGFIDAYLKLTAEEMKQYEREFERLTPEEQEQTMTLMPDWKREGIEIGRQEGEHKGKEDLVMRQIHRRLGSVPADVISSLDPLSSEQLDELGLALFDFTSVSDLEDWLSRNRSRKIPS